MAAGGHFGFWPLLGLAHTFARGIGAQFFFKYLKVSESTLKPSSALGGHGRSKYDPTNDITICCCCKLDKTLKLLNSINMWLSLCATETILFGTSNQAEINELRH